MSVACSNGNYDEIMKTIEEWTRESEISRQKRQSMVSTQVQHGKKVKPPIHKNKKSHKHYNVFKIDARRMI